MADPIETTARIAVIAIHGVADQKPNDTARAAADLLLRAETVRPELLPRKIFGDEDRKQISTGHYQGFEQRELRIAVHGLQPSKDAVAAKVAGPSESSPAPREIIRRAFSFRQQPKTVVARLRPTEEKKTPEADIPGAAATTAVAEDISKDGISLTYMDEQLSHCVIPESEAMYETVRLDSVRTGSRAHVHVFEMYWADLSRPVGSFIRWIIEFYQLLFHLCLLGRKSLDFARAEYERDARLEKPFRAMVWPFFGWSQLIAEQSFALFVPLLNLYLLGIASAIVPLLLPVEYLPKAVIGVIAVAVALLAGFLIYLWRQLIAPGGRPWPIFIAPLLAISGVVGWLCFHCWIRPGNALGWTMAVWWVVPVVAISWLMASYQKSRRGAFPLSLIVGAVITVLYGHELWSSHSSTPDIMKALLRTAELTVNLLTLCWILIMFMAFLATLAGFLVKKGVPDQETPEATRLARDKARRAAWTANLTLVLPALTVLIVNLTLWQALITTFVPDKLPVATKETGWNVVKKSEVWQAEGRPVFSDWGQKLVTIKDADHLYAWEVVRALMARSYTPFYFLTCGLFCLAALLTVWSILPAVMGELRPGGERSLSPEQRQKKSSWLGESLSSGFTAMRAAGEIVRWTFLVLPVQIAILLVLLKKFPSLPARLLPLNEGFLYVGAGIVLGIVASRGPFKALALGLRSGLDVALDVINWLRLHPLEGNPRARICARFHSLLRYIEEWKDPADEHGYKAIVILAHSQGTVITADFLRYLSARGMSPTLPIYLFTMGCPLRQLYSLRFPHLYGWSRHADDTWAGSEPLPASIGVELWVNAYRSGDYVGRHLWHPDTGDNIWSTSLTHVARDKREFCIGAGAHTHYWDESAPEIAVELDRLVGLAAYQP